VESAIAQPATLDVSRTTQVLDERGWGKPVARSPVFWIAFWRRRKPLEIKAERDPSAGRLFARGLCGRQRQLQVVFAASVHAIFRVACQNVADRLHAAHTV